MKSQALGSTRPHASRIRWANDPAVGGEACDAESGFTLVEVLVSLVLLALLLSLMPATLRMARQSWQAEAQLERSASLSSATDTLRRTLASAVPMPSPRASGQSPALVFDGKNESIAFVAPAPSGFETGGLQVFALMTQPRERGAGRNLVLTVGPYFPGDRDLQETQERNKRSETVLAEDIGQLRVRYFGPSLDGSERIWHDDWSGRATLPLLVDVRFSLASGGRAPELIVVAPRLGQGR